MTKRAQARFGVFLVLPVMILVTVFFLFPLGSAIRLSVVDFDGLNENPPFVGLDNFARMFADPEVLHALSNNLIWVVVGSVVPLLIGLFVAMLLWGIRRGSLFYRIVFFLPYIVPSVAIAIIWRWIYDPLSGWLNQVLRLAGFGDVTFGWLGAPSTAFAAVLVAAMWAQVGFVVVVLLSALRNVNLELLDAAYLDGAGPVQRVRYVVVPQIMPVFLMVFTLMLVTGFSVFDLIFVMTGGGPADATNVLGTYSYHQAFQLFDIGYGTALALLMTVLAVPCAIVLNRLQRRLSLQGTGA